MAMTPSKTRQEWIAWHDAKCAKRGESCFAESDCQEMFDSDNGLLQYTIEKNVFIMREVIGNLSFWEPRANWKARVEGCDMLASFYKTDNPKPLERLYKAKALPHMGGYLFVRKVT